MNLHVLQRHCHDQKTAKLDAALAPEQAQVSMTMTHVGEETGAEKSACMVLGRQRGK
jgi:hypothetical protein